MIGNKTFNIDNEYALRVRNNRWKRYEIYKPKSWTDRTEYIAAFSDDGKEWLFVDFPRRELGYMSTKSISLVVKKLKALNINRRYVMQPCMGCAGSSDRATDYDKWSHDTVEELEQI